MFGSVALSLVLTALFAATGGYALLRWASLRAGVAGRAGDQVAELAHLLMGVAMIAMTWGYVTTAANVAQLVLFGLLSGYFLVRWVVARVSRSVCPCPAPGFHLLMCVAMIWMVVAMPWLMTAMAGGGSAGMEMDGMSMPMPASPTAAPVPEWSASGTSLDTAPWFTVPVTVAIAVALVAGAGHWVRRLSQLTPRPAPADAATTAAATSSADPAAAPVVAAGASGPTVGDTATTGAGGTGTADTGTGGTGTGGTGTGGTATVVRATPVGPAAERVLALLTPRADALCHLLMSLAMAAMTLLML